jgi:hypothetical protein
VGSLIIGLVLVGVAVFLAVEVKSLLVGESADPEIEKATRDVVREHAKLSEVLNIITVQQGPGEVLVALKIRLARRASRARRRAGRSTPSRSRSRRSGPRCAGSSSSRTCSSSARSSGVHVLLDHL